MVHVRTRIYGKGTTRWLALCMVVVLLVLRTDPIVHEVINYYHIYIF